MSKYIASDAVFHLESFPPVRHLRKIYVKSIPEDMADELRVRGYTIVYVNSLPRNTDLEELEYLRALARGVEENTIGMTEMQFKALDAELKINNMIGARSNAAEAPDDHSKKTVDQLMAWQPSRHTQARNTSVIGVEHGGEFYKDTSSN